MTLNYPRAWLLLAAGVLALSSLPAVAERMYVADKRVLNVYAEPYQESEHVATLETGETVETIEQLGNFTRIQLDDDREGWVLANDLTLDAPASVRLRALEQEHKAATQKLEKQFKAQIEELQKQNVALESELDGLKEAAAKSAAEAQAKVAEAQRAAAAVKAEPAPEKTDFNFAWLWAPLVLAVGGASCAAGYQTLARKIRNKFGGVKIYQ